MYDKQQSDAPANEPSTSPPSPVEVLPVLPSISASAGAVYQTLPDTTRLVVAYKRVAPAPRVGGSEGRHGKGVWVVVVIVVPVVVLV